VIQLKWHLARVHLHLVYPAPLLFQFVLDRSIKIFAYFNHINIQ